MFQKYDENERHTERDSQKQNVLNERLENMNNLMVRLAKKRNELEKMNSNLVATSHLNKKHIESNKIRMEIEIQQLQHALESKLQKLHYFIVIWC